MRPTSPVCSDRLRSLLVLALVVPATGWAAGEEDVYFSELPVVASVSRLPQALADAPTSVTVIDRDIIRASGARDLSDVFRLVPGFQTYPHTTEAPRVAYHGLGDGDYASRVQVMIDGRSLYSPLFGSGVNWATVPVALEDIERIEVVRGTNAVSYGSNAYLGVINIITVDPSLVRGVSVSSNYGNQNVRDYTLRAGGKLGEAGHVRFTYRSQNDDALRNRGDWVDSYGTQLFDLRADLALGDRDTLQIGLGTAEGLVQNGRLRPAGATGPDENPIREMRQSSSYAQLQWRRVLSSASDIQLRYTHTTDRSDDTFNVTVPGLGTFNVNQSGDEGARDEIEMLHTLRLAATTRFSWGGSWRNDSMRSAWTLPGMSVVHRETTRVFGNLEWKPTVWFTGNLGMAGENDSFAGNNGMPRLSASFHLDRQNTLRFGMSRASRTASIKAYRGQQQAAGQYFYAATPDLPVERLDTIEVGYLGDWRDWRASLDVRLFNERIYDRQFVIDLGENDDTKPKAAAPIQNVRVEGVEYQFKWQPFEPTRILLNQTFGRVKSQYLASALALTNSTVQTNPTGIAEFTDNSMPARSTSLLLMQKLPFGLEFSAAGYWQDTMKWSTHSTSWKYHRVDARLGYPFRFGAVGGELALTMQSLNGRHQEYKSDDSPSNPNGRLVERRQWLTLRLDY